MPISRSTAVTKKGLIAGMVPVAVALLPLLRKRLGLRFFSLPSIALFIASIVLQRGMQQK